MDYKLQIEFQNLVKKLEDEFGEGLDVNAIMVLIGVQELGQGYKKFSKDEKINLMHIATCTILEPYGYYKFDKLDDDGWPHFNLVENLPNLTTQEQEFLMKEAVLNYFKVNKIYEI